MARRAWAEQVLVTVAIVSALVMPASPANGAKPPGGGTSYEWIDQLATTQHDEVTAVAVDDVGDLLLVGRVGDTTQWDTFVRKLRPTTNGVTEIWYRVYATPNSDFAEDVAVDATGNVFVVGGSEGDMTPNDGHFDGYIRAYDAGGSFLWHQQVSGSTLGGNDWVTAVAVAPSGRLYTTGTVESVAFLRAYDVTSTGAVLAFDDRWTEFQGWVNPRGISIRTTGGVDEALVAAAEHGGSPFVRQYLDGRHEQTVRLTIATPTRDVEPAGVAFAGTNTVVAGTAETYGEVRPFMTALDSTLSQRWTYLAPVGADRRVNGLAATQSAIYVAGSRGPDSDVTFTKHDADSGAVLTSTVFGQRATLDRGDDVVISGGKAFLTGTTSGRYERLSGLRTRDAFVARFAL